MSDRKRGKPDAARTCLDLASLAHAQGDSEAATDYLARAHSQFTVLKMPALVRQAEQLATELGIDLAVPVEG